MTTQKEYNKLWKFVEGYVDYLRNQIPFTLLLSHGYSLDDRKEWKKLMKKFHQTGKRSRK